jgi:hypothetical protein
MSPLYYVHCIGIASLLVSDGTLWCITKKNVKLYSLDIYDNRKHSETKRTFTIFILGCCILLRIYPTWLPMTPSIATKFQYVNSIILFSSHGVIGSQVVLSQDLSSVRLITWETTHPSSLSEWILVTFKHKHFKYPSPMCYYLPETSFVLPHILSKQRYGLKCCVFNQIFWFSSYFQNGTWWVSNRATL